MDYVWAVWEILEFPSAIFFSVDEFLVLGGKGINEQGVLLLGTLLGGRESCVTSGTCE